ncbi:hypothetical protein DNTS_029572 [Danionella cerebrum]|nr:hypothetical protein DNTS_029572 [Danionella translucida]
MGISQLDTLETTSPNSKYTLANVENRTGQLPCEKGLKEVLESEKSLHFPKTQELCDKRKIISIQPCNGFNSSFSFIQQSLEISDSSLTTENKQPESALKQTLQFERLNSGLLNPHSLTNRLSKSATCHMSQPETKPNLTTHLEPPTVFQLDNKNNPIDQSEASTFLKLKPEKQLVTAGPSKSSTISTIQSETSTIHISNLGNNSKINNQPQSSTVLIKPLETIPSLESQPKTSTIPFGQLNTSTYSIREPGNKNASICDSKSISNCQSETSIDSVKQKVTPSKATFVLRNQSKTTLARINQIESATVATSQLEHEVYTTSGFSYSIDQLVQQKDLSVFRELWVMDQPTQANHSELLLAKQIIQDSDSVDTDSASSVTSGYESTSTSSEPIRDGPMKKFEDILQDCLQSNRANKKIESTMAKLQRLQHKAVLDDDYDTAEHFGKKLEDLRTERVSLKPGLPSKQSEISEFLEHLRSVVNSAICRTHSDSWKNEVAESTRSQVRTREKLLEEKERIQSQICVLQRRLHELQRLSVDLELQLDHKEKIRITGQPLDENRSAEGPFLDIQVPVQQVEEKLPLLCTHGSIEEKSMNEAPYPSTKGSALKDIFTADGQWVCSLPHAQDEMITSDGLFQRACDLALVLEDLLTSEHRQQISMCPPEEVHRLQEQEQSLNLSIKEETSKVVLNQRLSFSLRQKIGASETQLLTLHEAKLSAVSGNDFSSAKELKAEIRSVCGEREHLEVVLQKLQEQRGVREVELKQMKEKHGHIKVQLQEKNTEHEHRLKENTLKYIEFLEDRLHSCGSAVLERVLEADLEACVLLLKTLDQRSQSFSSEAEEHPSLSKEEADCAMLTALGGRWCPETDLQHSQFTKKLQEFLFCLEETSPEDLSEESTELTERCTLISERLHYLENQLQTAMDNNNKSLTHILPFIQGFNFIQYST